MIKTKYLNELEISDTCQVGSKGKDVRKIQEWLNIQAYLNPQATLATGIDGSYGPGTKASIESFQRLKGLSVTGAVNSSVFAALCEPMQNAYDFREAPPHTLRQVICAIATAHQQVSPIELTIKGVSNLGPWVRAYCNGNEGNEWFWCMGFVQTIFDQAFENLENGEVFTSLMPSTFSCDVVAVYGKANGKLITNSQVKSDPSLVQPGDIFLLKKSENDWHHTGIIIGVTDDLFETIEGNTNVDGSNNGFGVFRRTRNFRKSTLDVFSVT